MSVSVSQTRDPLSLSVQYQYLLFTIAVLDMKHRQCPENVHVYEGKHKDRQRIRYDHIKRFALSVHQQTNRSLTVTAPCLQQTHKMEGMVTHPINITS